MGASGVAGIFEGGQKGGGKGVDMFEAREFVF